MRVNKYRVELDNGASFPISGATSEADARRLAEKEIEKDKPQYIGARVASVELTERGRWG